MKIAFTTKIISPEVGVRVAGYGPDDFTVAKHDDLYLSVLALNDGEKTCLLLGYDPWTLGLQLHQVQCERLMDKIGIAYNPSEKYRGISGRIHPSPQKPEFLKV